MPSTKCHIYCLVGNKILVVDYPSLTYAEVQPDCGNVLDFELYKIREMKIHEGGNKKETLHNIAILRKSGDIQIYNYNNIQDDAMITSFTLHGPPNQQGMSTCNIQQAIRLNV